MNKKIYDNMSYQLFLKIIQKYGSIENIPECVMKAYSKAQEKLQSKRIKYETHDENDWIGV